MQILQGNSNYIGKNCDGRKRLEYIDQLVSDVGCVGYAELKIYLRIGIL